MTTLIGKALGEGNCVRATVGGKEALAKTARLRTETSTTNLRSVPGPEQPGE